MQYDHSCTHDFGIPGAVLMTHAAVECAAIIRRELPAGAPRVVALCGGGNNGGDGYAIIRTLHSHGINAVAFEVAPCRAESDACIMRESAHRMGLIHPWSSLLQIIHEEDQIVIVDSIFGTGLSRAPTGPALDAIHWINARAAAGSPVYAIDLPSGLDCNSGQALGAANDAVIASRTLTIVCQKTGFSALSARPHLGAITEISIGGPPLTRERRIVE